MILDDLLALASDRTGSVIGTLLAPSGEWLAELGAVDGRIWRVEIAQGDVAPLSARISPATKAEAAKAQRDGSGTESLSRKALAEIQQCHLETVIDGLLALALVIEQSPGSVWDFRPTSQPTRTGRIRGHHKSAITAGLRKKGINIMATNLERVIGVEQTKVPECVAIGYVDMASGMLIAVKTVGSHPPDVLNLVAAATADVFQGPNVTEIERQFRKSRGQQEDGSHYFKRIVAMSDALTHVMIRGTRIPDHAVVFVCRGTANLGAILSKAALAAQAIEAAA